MRIGVHQPNYLPWLGYFRKMAICDIFVFFDDVQFEKRGYTNRANIRIGEGSKLLTQPIVKCSRIESNIANLMFSSHDRWRENHKRSIEMNYRRRPFYNEVLNFIEEIYSGQQQDLAGFNIRAINLLSERLSIKAVFLRSSNLDYSRDGSASEKIASICSTLRGNIYCSGKGGKKYNDEAIFSKFGVKIEYEEWTPPSYPQGADFLQGLSIIDAIANIGIRGVAELITD
jgi:hypothetical protein